MTEPLELRRRAADAFDRHVAAVRAEQWRAPTPCTEWDVRELVNHLVVEQLWVPPLMGGATVAEVGDRFDGDQLGDDPLATWRASRAAADAALAEPGALERAVHLSFGDTPGEEYCFQLTTDLLVHGWDLARAVGDDETMDLELVQVVHERIGPQADQLAASGLFAPPVPVGADADPATRLLALFGRRA